MLGNAVSHFFFYICGGIATTIALLSTGGFVWGAIARPAPCHSAPDFITGGLFGAMMAWMQYGLLAGAAGAWLGFFIAIGIFLGKRRPKSPAHHADG